MSGENGELIFDDLSPQEKKVQLLGQWYVVREASEDAAVKWRNANIRAAKMTNGKVTGMGDVADSEPLLVSLCLYRADDNGNLPTLADGSPNPSSLVSLSKVRSWPARMVRSLFDWIKEASDLSDETAEALEKRIREDTKKLAKLRQGEGRAKNAPGAMALTST